MAICLSAFAGCTSFTHERLLSENKISSSSVHTDYFQHRLFRTTAPAPENPGNQLHIYLGGDGRPWRTPEQIARDPTSEQSIMLRAMLKSSINSVYLGRPCYYQVADSRCSGNWWTYDRYHSDVVESLVEAVESLAKNHGELWLIGFSGGGSLAVLAGNRLERPVNVVTINGNLDHQAWTEYHRYSPLARSLNPVLDPAHNPGMRSLHWYARQDRNVLPSWILAFCRKTKTHCAPVAGGHNSGWPAVWPDMLNYSQEFFSQPSAQAPPEPSASLSGTELPESLPTQ